MSRPAAEGRAAASAGNAWRYALLGGAVAGLALSPVVSGSAGGAVEASGSSPPSAELAVGAVASLLALAFARPRVRGRRRLAWLACLGLASCGLGLAAGAARVSAIDGGAFRGPVGSETRVRGIVSAVPRRSEGTVRVRLQTAAGRLLLSAREPVPELPIGHEVSARGLVCAAADWEAAYLARHGIAQVLEADRLTLTGRRRAGAAALIDSIRDRAQIALERGAAQRESALLRGFVLGEDDRIDPRTIEDFRRSGLAHLLAVSGQNVLLLALLAAPILGLLGASLRARLVWILALIAVYVPIAGAGPSIQRAGVMGAAAVIATLASRPSSRWYSLLLAGLVTLALNPRALGDAGWQLSFAAVAGIALLAGPLRELLAGAVPAQATDAGRRSWRAALADGVAVTLAATLATAPLMAHHFEVVSLVAIPANLLALPAVAPVMWLGMLAAAAGQLAWLPVEPLTGLAALLVGYIAQVAHWFASPGWAQVDARLGSPAGLAVAYAGLVASAGATLLWARRRAGVRPRRALVAVCGLAVAAVAIAALISTAIEGDRQRSAPALAIHVLDVGQGDAIVLDPRRSDPVLIDGGPPGGELLECLDELGIEHLAAAIVTHDQADHSGGIRELLGMLPVDSLLYARAGRDLIAAARTASVPVTAIAEGSGLRAGRLELEVLWPPRAMLDGPGAGSGDPNALSLVVLARWDEFEMLLTGDAEAELAPVDPGPVELLKVAHHGSEDAGLDALLDSLVPQLAVISVGAGNTYGHPAPPTLAELAAHDVPALRTDELGTVSIAVDRQGWRLQEPG